MWKYFYRNTRYPKTEWTSFDLHSSQIYTLLIMKFEVSYKNKITNTLQVMLILSTKLGTYCYILWLCSYIKKYYIIFLLWKMILMKRDCVVQGTNLGILVYKIMNVLSFQKKNLFSLDLHQQGFKALFFLMTLWCQKAYPLSSEWVPEESSKAFHLFGRKCIPWLTMYDSSNFALTM